MRHTNRKDSEVRMLHFIKDLHKQITKDGDDMPRTVYTAMTHHMGWTAVAVLREAGIVHKAGWRWYWIGPAPSEQMAQELSERRLQMQRERMTNYLRR